MKNENIAAEIVYILQRVYQIDPDLVGGFSFDRASSNLAAIKMLQVIYTKSFALPCGSHSLDHVGERVTQRANFIRKFFEALNGLFGKSPKATDLWRSIAGSSFPSHSDTRWWSQYEVYVYMFVNRFARDDFITQAKQHQFCDSAYVKRLYEVTFGSKDGEDWKYTELELISVIETMRPFVCITYLNEGDGLPVLFFYDALKFLQQFIEQSHFPLTDAVIATLVGDEVPAAVAQKTQEYKDYSNFLTRKAFRYFNENLLAGDVGEKLPFFKACRLLNPSHIKALVAAHSLPGLQDHVRRELTALAHLVPEQKIGMLLSELPAYVNLSNEYAGNWLFKPPTPWNSFDDVKSFKKKLHESVGLEVLAFWKQHSELIPKWAELAAEIFILAPSSAAVERLFSLLRDKFDEKNLQRSLLDFVETSLLLRYNSRKLPA
jgi:hypothetical protein